MTRKATVTRRGRKRRGGRAQGVELQTAMSGGGAMTGGGEAQASERGSANARQRTARRHAGPAAAAEASLHSVRGRDTSSVGWAAPCTTGAPAVPLGPAMRPLQDWGMPCPASSVVAVPTTPIHPSLVP